MDNRPPSYLESLEAAADRALELIRYTTIQEPTISFGGITALNDAIGILAETRRGKPYTAPPVDPIAADDIADALPDDHIARDISAELGIKSLNSSFDPIYRLGYRRGIEDCRKYDQ